MDKRYRLDSMLGVVEELDNPVIVDRKGLQGEQAADDLEIVFDAMVNFLQQHLALMQLSFGALQRLQHLVNRNRELPQLIFSSR
jgi:hypothetical protein